MALFPERTARLVFIGEMGHVVVLPALYAHEEALQLLLHRLPCKSSILYKNAKNIRMVPRQ
jgi:hypothetical protein